MTVREFIADRLGRMVLWGAFAAGAGCFLLATGTAPGVVWLLLLLWLLVFLASEGADFLRCRARLAELTAIMAGLDRKYLFTECIPRAQNAYERRLLDLCRRAGRGMVGAVSDARAAQREYQEYVESWVHEVKTPITAAGLLCRSLAPETRRRLERELAQIGAHVERALFYARAESPEKDFLVRRASLAELADQAVAAHRTLLIGQGVRVETAGLAETVYTDSKWAVFVLGQLLQNAARYRREEAAPVVTLSARRAGSRVQLTVADNGMGIPAHELPRVFDRGFTGSNGRCRGGSTGMGLYLCKRLCGCLEVALDITSAEGEGTAVTLTFPGRMTET